MIISGIATRSILYQTGAVFFDFSFNAPSTSGQHKFGVSGSEFFGFTATNGKIFDPAGKFVYNYAPNENVNISGVVSPSSYNYSVNSNLLCWGQPTSSSLYGSAIKNLYASSSSEFQLSSFIRGEAADYSLDGAGAYIGVNSLVSGRLINNATGRPFRIFDVVLNGQSSYSLYSFTTGNISSTGYIVFSGDGFGMQDEIVQVSMQTNFGQVDYDFTISGDYGVVPDVYLNLSPDSNVVISNRPMYINAVAANYPSGSRIGVSLEYVSGTTGNIYFFSGQAGFGAQSMSGYLTGCGFLSYQCAGLVSGLDPKTLIWETGIGTGQFSTDFHCATGNISGNYSLPLYGLGAGAITLDYLASGESSGYFHGRIPIVGAWLNAISTNFSGAGSSPVSASGLIPVGTGKVFVYPTGEVRIEDPISSGDYYEANLSVSKVYSGPIVYDYSTVAVGFATGRTFSGIVTKSFAPEFEQGSYSFTKYFSGAVSSSAIISTGNFQITGCPSSALVSGLITGVFSASYPLLCSNTSNFPTIPIHGFPSSVYNRDGTLADPNTAFTFYPSGGFSTYDDSLENYLLGGGVKTRISRMGDTPSGWGDFSNPVADCAEFPREYPSSNDVTSHIWKERISGTESVSSFDSLDNGIGIVNTNLFMTGTGDFYADPSGAVDSGVMEFFISGSGLKAIALKGLNNGQTDRILNLTLYKNGVLSDSWESLYIESSLYDKYGEASYNTNAYDTLTISELGSGKYSLVVTAKTAPEPVVSFTQSIYTGCESSRAVSVTVQAVGYFRKPCCVNITNYSESTAHSGVHYDPIYLDYTDPVLISGGCQSVGAHAPRGMRCPGVCFPPTSPDYNGRWKEETQYVNFTIPIYDNSVYGEYASFYMYLDVASASGCSVVDATTEVRIVDNDNEQFEIGGTGIMPDISSLDCSLVPDVEPPEPPCIKDPSLCDPCILQPRLCNPCYDRPELCDPCFLDPTQCTGDEPPCRCIETIEIPCEGCSGSLMTIVGDCGGVAVSGQVGIPGATCGSATVAGCGPTAGYIFVGTIPKAKGTYFTSSFSGNCLSSSVLAYPSDCGMYNVCIGTDTEAECPTSIEWSGCSVINDAVSCSGAAGDGSMIHVGRTICSNLAAGEGAAEQRCSLDIFLEVSSTPTCDLHSHGCHSWAFTGQTVFPKGDPLLILCDALF
jgi:hypothetical protein